MESIQYSLAFEVYSRSNEQGEKTTGMYVAQLLMIMFYDIIFKASPCSLH